VVHSGQNYDYELNEIFFRELEVRSPDYFLDAVGATVAQTIGNVIAKSDEVIAKEQPDALLLLGDTNSCLAAISAKRRKIPIFHMEAGKWRLGTVALINGCPKKSIARLWIT
jgi:UDP-N-acetylglucosamine 2-epimerase (non-hydrolysing)